MHTVVYDCDESDEINGCKMLRHNEIHHRDLNTTVGSRGNATDSGMVHKHISLSKSEVKNTKDDYKFNTRYAYRSGAGSPSG